MVTEPRVRYRKSHVRTPKDWQEAMALLLENAGKWVLITYVGNSQHIDYLRENSMFTMAEPYGTDGNGNIVQTIWAMCPVFS